MEYSGLVGTQYQRESKKKKKVQLSLPTPPRCMEGVQAQLHSLISQLKMEVSGQLHASPPLTLGKEHQ
jgi:hypothetical protein